MNDEYYIDIAIEISKHAKYPYGAIVVKDDKIIGRSDDKTLMGKSMYEHPELMAIESASKDKNLYGDLKGATIYVSCQPCMMCMGAILYEEFEKIVYAATLKDSNDIYCPEVLTDIDELAKYSKNKIEIVKELHRESAVQVIKDRSNETQSPSLSDDLKFLISTVKEASLLITDTFEVKSKDNNGDLITNFDYEIEEYINNKIKENYPDFSIISEEYNNENILVDNCFTVDPIDGTINFAHNIPLWGIQVACIRDGKTCAAVIYLPKLDELYYADSNGAFLNGSPIHVNSLDITKGLYTIDGRNKLPGQVKMSKHSPHGRDFYCAACDFAFVACGRLSATNFVRDNLWDYTPGQFIVEKAGGVIYNSKNMHIAANKESVLNVIKENTLVTTDEEVIVAKKD